MKKKHTHKDYSWLTASIVLVIYALIMAFGASYGGLAISAHMGLLTRKTVNTREVCTKVEISKRNYSIKKYSHNSDTKVYDFHCSTGEVYRICCNDLEDDGISDEQLQSLCGSVLTVEFSSVRLLQKSYPLLSIENENGIVVPKQITVKYWERSWRGAYFLLLFWGGLGAFIILRNTICTIIRTAKKNYRKRRKKLRRKEQLQKRMQKKNCSEQDTT